MTDDGPAVASFELTVERDAISIATVRRFVSELCTRVLASSQITSNVLVATHELLDNAIRHSAREPCTLRVECRRIGHEAVVSIFTKNRVSEDRRRDLERLLEELRRSDDPATFYRALLERAASGAERAGLGLGRVHAEADFHLTVVFDDDEATIRAEGRFPLGI